MVDGLRKILETSNVAIATKNAFHRHIWRRLVNHPFLTWERYTPICRIAETTSSMKLGTLNVARVAPSKESDPSRSTNSSSGTPKTPE